MEKFEKCRCGKVAQWVYMPGYGDGHSPYSCDDCVSRGCSCNTHSINEEYRGLPDSTKIEGVDWEWIKKGDKTIGFDIANDKEYWRYIDEKGRPYPCCEYEWEENGFYTEEYQKYLEDKCKEIGYDILSDPKEKKWFDEFGYIVWTNELIEKVEKMLSI